MTLLRAGNVLLAFGLVFGCIFAVVGMLLVIVGVETLRRWASSRRWTEVPARIVTSEVREVSCFEDQRMFKPEVRFIYAAGGGEANSGDIAFAGKLYRTHEQAAKVLSRYPVGMIVQARYNPDDPAQAVLVRKGVGAGLLVAGIGLAMISASLVAARQADLPPGMLGGIALAALMIVFLLGSRMRAGLSRARRSGMYPHPGCGSDADVERLVRQGEKMLAIRLYRELHGTDLKTARLQVEEMMRTLSGQ